VGGGLGGLVTAVALARQGLACTVIEKKAYPFHRVCGEYISNETIPFLKSLGLYPTQMDLPQINRLQLTSVNGRSAFLPLDLGGFGISRYVLDEFIYQRARSLGVEFILNQEVEGITFGDEQFEVKYNHEVHRADVVVGAFGKRSKLDVALNRAFIRRRSPYLAVKYHIRTDHPRDLIALHNFENGYCGMSQVEGDKQCLCYLSHRDNLRKYRDIARMEEAVLHRNPFLKSIFKSAEFIFSKPETINEITFERKRLIENHVLMCGDAAGMITPLCGNGMAIAIHAAKLLSCAIAAYGAGAISREQMEARYTTEWTQMFARRLWAGRQIQRLFGSVRASDFAVNLARHWKPAAGFLVSQTHGQPF